MSQPAAELDEEEAFLARWRAAWDEWAAIRDEMIAAVSGPVTAYQVSLEQRKRMLARGERPLSLEEIERVLGIKGAEGEGS